MKKHKNGVSLTSASAHELVTNDYKIFIETHTGATSGFRNNDYGEVGASIIQTQDEI